LNPKSNTAAEHEMNVGVLKEVTSTGNEVNFIGSAWENNSGGCYLICFSSIIDQTGGSNKRNNNKRYFFLLYYTNIRY